MFRFAILSGVSSDPQAREEKGSLDDQIKTARRAGEQQGGVETVGPFVLDGYSRSGYVNLSDALSDIPPLAEAIRAAIEDQYDVLIVDNVERMGDLAPMISTMMKKHRKQIHSARQPSRIYEPDEYDPRSDESADIMIHVEGIIQNYRRNKLLRGLRLGIEKRVENGRHSTTFPYGYRRGARPDDDLAVDPPVAALLIQLKDEFLHGAPLSRLMQIAQDSGIPSKGGPRWHRFTIRRMLCNPFYAGKVFSGRWKTVGYTKGKTSAKRSPVMKLNPDPLLLRDGKHPPLWTWEEHEQIVAEMEERYRKFPRYDPHTFSGLMKCTVCGKQVRFRGRKYRCATTPDHIGLKESDANVLIAKALADALRNYKDEEPAARVTVSTAGTIAELRKRIAMIQNEFESDSGMYTATEAREKTQALRAQIKAIESRQADRKHQDAVRQRRAAKREELLPKLHLLQHLFVQEEPGVNNRMLRDVVTTIYVTPEHTFTFDFR
jgi:DNA invertase Pin-like site-specific DNA recombinase